METAFNYWLGTDETLFFKTIGQILSDSDPTMWNKVKYYYEQENNKSLLEVIQSELNKDEYGQFKDLFLTNGTALNGLVRLVSNEPTTVYNAHLQGLQTVGARTCLGNLTNKFTGNNGKWLGFSYKGNDRYVDEKKVYLI